MGILSLDIEDILATVISAMLPIILLKVPSSNQRSILLLCHRRGTRRGVGACEVERQGKLRRGMVGECHGGEAHWVDATMGEKGKRVSMEWESKGK